MQSLYPIKAKYSQNGKWCNTACFAPLRRKITLWFSSKSFVQRRTLIIRTKKHIFLIRVSYFTCELRVKREISGEMCSNVWLLLLEETTKDSPTHTSLKKCMIQVPLRKQASHCGRSKEQRSDYNLQIYKHSHEHAEVAAVPAALLEGCLQIGVRLEINDQWLKIKYERSDNINLSH